MLLDISKEIIDFIEDRASNIDELELKDSLSYVKFFSQDDVDESETLAAMYDRDEDELYICIGEKNSLDFMNIATECKCEGKYLIRSNDHIMSEEEILPSVSWLLETLETCTEETGDKIKLIKRDIDKITEYGQQIKFRAFEHCRVKLNA